MQCFCQFWKMFCLRDNPSFKCHVLLLYREVEVLRVSDKYFCFSRLTFLVLRWYHGLLGLIITERLRYLTKNVRGDDFCRLLSVAGSGLIRKPSQSIWNNGDFYVDPPRLTRESGLFRHSPSSFILLAAWQKGLARLLFIQQYGKNSGEQSDALRVFPYSGYCCRADGDRSYQHGIASLRRWTNFVDRQPRA